MLKFFIFMMKDTIILISDIDMDEAPSLSLILIHISQCRDIIAVLQILWYSYRKVIFIARQWRIGCFNDSRFDDFVYHTLGHWVRVVSTVQWHRKLLLPNQGDLQETAAELCDKWCSIRHNGSDQAIYRECEQWQCDKVCEICVSIDWIVVLIVKLI